MDRARIKNRSILDGLGEEIVRIVSPVSVCMLLVVVLVSILNNSSSSTSSSITTIATLIYNEKSSDSDWEKFGGALLNALVFVGVVTVVTFLLVCLFYYRCIRFLRFYMTFASFIVLAYMGGGVAILLIQALSIPIDCITFGIVLFNFAVVGVLSVFLCKVPIVFTQGYLVLIGVLVAYWFTILPEWTTWVLLVAMAIYDIVAVLIPGGPLRILVELAMSRDEEIPALIYEARPVATDRGVRHENVATTEEPSNDLMVPSLMERGEDLQRQRGIWRKPRDSGSALWKSLNSGGEESAASASVSLTHGSLAQDLSVMVAEEEERHGGGSTTEEELLNHQMGSSSSRHADRQVGSSDMSELERLLDHSDGGRRPNEVLQPNGAVELADGYEDGGLGLSASGAIKLGLGDFIFYSVLVGRAAMYDYMTVYACYLAIIAGLGVTLILLAFFQKALPALPVSISLGVVFYFLTRLVLEAFVVQITVHLLLF
uniref:Presenilin n=1 Tax=Araucaria cunninghamii TaxID=56994 RepID=A0A0D6R6S5_ARACU